MRYLNCWDNKNFWGARTGPLTHASAVKSTFQYTIEYTSWFYTGIEDWFFLHHMKKIKKIARDCYYTGFSKPSGTFALGLFVIIPFSSHFPQRSVTKFGKFSQYCTWVAYFFYFFIWIYIPVVDIWSKVGHLKFQYK